MVKELVVDRTPYLQLFTHCVHVVLADFLLHAVQVRRAGYIPSRCLRCHWQSTPNSQDRVREKERDPSTTTSQADTLNSNMQWLPCDCISFAVECVIHANQYSHAETRDYNCNTFPMNAAKLSSSAVRPTKSNVSKIDKSLPNEMSLTLWSGNWAYQPMLCFSRQAQNHIARHRHDM